MGRGRRRHDRFPRFLEVSFELGGRLVRGITTDVSLSGAFVNTLCEAPLGTKVTLQYGPPGGGAAVYLSGNVARAIAPKGAEEVPGFGLRWDTARTRGTIAHLRDVLKDLFGIQVRVKADREGGAIWLASRAKPVPHVWSEAIAQDLARIGRPGPCEDLPGFDVGTELTWLAEQQRMRAVVTGTGDGYFTVRCQDARKPGNVVAFSHQSPEPGAWSVLRIVGVTTQERPADNEFRVDVLRVDLPESPAEFRKNHPRTKIMVAPAIKSG